MSIFGPKNEISNAVIIMHTILITINSRYLSKYNLIEMLSIDVFPFRLLNIYLLIYTFSFEANINDVVVIAKQGYNNNKQNKTPFNSKSLYK